MAEKAKRLLTPVGFAKWAHVHNPKAAYQEKDGKPKGEPKFMIDLCFSADDMEWKKWAGDLKAEIMALPMQIDKHTGAPIAKQMPIKRELDIDDKPSGRYFVTFKTGEKFKPPVFDRYGMAIPETILVGNESKVRVAYSPVEYTAFGGGIALYLNAVQVVELVEYRASTAEAYGFQVDPLVMADMPVSAEGAFDGFESDIPF